MKIVVFTGAGVSKESGISTFRDSEDGLWENYKIEDVASPKGWHNNRSNVLDFYNKRRSELKDVEPNEAHLLIAELEKYHEVTVITQNVDDLHERAGSSNILHLHGELTKSRGYYYDHKISPLDPIYDIGYDPIIEGSKCETTGSEIRPHIVWFGEMPYNVEESYKALLECDIVLIIGTSLQITYTLDMLGDTSEGKTFYYIDPSPSEYLDSYTDVNYIKKGAIEGIKIFMREMGINK